MRLRDTWFGLATAAALLGAVGAAEAGELTFSDPGFADYGAIPQGYADDVSDTPHVTVSYRVLDASTLEEVSDAVVSYWGGDDDDDFGDLQGVAYNGAPTYMDKYLLEIALIASPGYVVTLDSFDIAGFPDPDFNPSTQQDPAWPTANWEHQTLWVLDGDGNDLFFDDDLTILGSENGQPTHMTYTPGYTSGQIVIRLGTTWNVAIDNILFSETVDAEVTQTSVVPLPPAAALGFVGLGIAALVRRRRRSQPLA